MKVYKYSWSDDTVLELNVDREIVELLVGVFKQKVKESVNNDDFNSAKSHIKSIDLLEEILAKDEEKKAQEENKD